MLRMGGRCAALIAATFCIWTGAAHAVEQRVGVTAAVNPATTGSPPEGETRALFVGADVLYNERIVTTNGGQAQIIFLDQSALTVAPNSDVTIDKFVYDPNKGAGQLAATVTKGALRFVGGRISKQQDVVFSTPSSTVGIRGGVLMINVEPNGATQATFLFGEHMNVTSGGVTQTVTRPGFSVTVNLPNQPPGAPFPTPRQLIQQTLQSLEGNQGATGGAKQVPTDQRIALVNLTQTLLNSNPTTFVVGNQGPKTVTFQLPADNPQFAPGPNANKSGGARNPNNTSNPPNTNNSTNTSNSTSTSTNTNTSSSGSSTPPPAPTPTRTTQTLNGYAAGLAPDADEPASSRTILGNQNSRPEDLTVATSVEQNKASATFNIGGDDENNQFSFEFGTGSGQKSSTFTNDQDFSAKSIIHIDEMTFATNQMETNNLANVTIVNPGNVSFCQCQYVQWGFWSGQAVNGEEHVTVTDATWVAGPLASIDEFKNKQPQGTATYNGHIIGNVQNGASQYIAVGGFTNTWNFGTRSGTIAINQFDGLNFSGPAAATAANPRDYSGGFPSANTKNGSPVNVTLNGSFFKGGGDVAAETGGQFNMTGTNYKAAGTFAAKK